MTRQHRALAFPALLAAAGLLLTGCGSGSSGTNQVSSLAGSSSAAKPSPTASGNVEKELLAYTECLRGQGLDVPDPSVDADGKITFARPAGGATPGAGGGIDRTKLDAAQKVCGPVPAGVTSALTGGDQTAIQDAALKFAQCMRGQGIDMADPDFSKSTNPGDMFQGLDQNDPKVQAAMTVCQKAFTGIAGGN
jgi:hypothetical protein